MKKIDFWILPVMVFLLLLVSCQSIDDYRRERVEKADKAFEKIKSRKFPDHKLLTLPFCIETALTIIKVSFMTSLSIPINKY